MNIDANIQQSKINSHQQGYLTTNTHNLLAYTDKRVTIRQVFNSINYVRQP